MNMTPEMTKTKGKRTTYIIVAIGILFLLGIAVAIIGIAIGVFIYSSQPTHTFDPPGDRPVRSNGETARTSDGGTRTEAIVEQLRTSKTVGRFTLQNVSPVRDKKAFINSEGEAYGIYTAGNRTIKFLVAEYKDRSLASVDFGRMLGNVRAGGARVVKNMRVKDGMIDTAFENGSTKNIAYCVLSAKPNVICHTISSESGSAITEFSDSFWNGKK